MCCDRTRVYVLLRSAYEQLIVIHQEQTEQCKSLTRQGSGFFQTLNQWCAGKTLTHCQSLIVNSNQPLMGSHCMKEFKLHITNILCLICGFVFIKCSEPVGIDVFVGTLLKRQTRLSMREETNNVLCHNSQHQTGSNLRRAEQSKVFLSLQRKSC